MTSESVPQPRRLLVLRHAKAGRAGATDLERPLAARGRRDAHAVGRLLVARGWRPDVVACSPALRTRQTWQCAADAGVEAGDVRFVDAIYLAGAAELVGVVRGLPAPIRTALLVGHSPGVAEIVALLTGPEAAEGHGRPSSFPTAGLAVLSLATDWAEAGPGRAELTAFEVPGGTE